METSKRRRDRPCILQRRLGSIIFVQSISWFYCGRLRTTMRNSARVVYAQKFTKDVVRITVGCRTLESHNMQLYCTEPARTSCSERVMECRKSLDLRWKLQNEKRGWRAVHRTEEVSHDEFREHESHRQAVGRLTNSFISISDSGIRLEGAYNTNRPMTGMSHTSLRQMLETVSLLVAFLTVSIVSTPNTPNELAISRTCV